jgi:hypothetical protein
MNPDVRRSRKSLHESVPGDDVAKVGAKWRELHDSRHLRTKAAQVSMFRVLGVDRKDAVEEFFPGSTRQ